MGWWTRSPKGWQADKNQQARIKTLLQGFSEEIPRLWTEEERERLRGNYWQYVGGRAEFCQRFTERLTVRFGAAFLDQALVEFLAFPAENPLPKTALEGSEDARSLACLAFFIASEWVAQRGGDYALGLVGKRLRHLLAHVEEDPLFCDPAMGKFIAYVGAYIYYGLHIKECMQVLARRHSHPLALDLIDQMLRGDWDGPVTMPGSPGVPPRETTRYAVAGERLYSVFYEQDTHLNVPNLLYAAGRLDYARLLDLYHRFPRLIPFSLFWYEPEQVAALPPVWREVHGFVQTLGWTVIENWDKQGLNRLHDYHVKCRGSRWLLAACERVEKLGLSVLVEEENCIDYPMRLLKIMARTEGLAPDEDPDAVVERLRGFSPQTLKAVLPFTRSGIKWVLQALGWEDLQPVLAWVLGLAKLPPAADAHSGNVWAGVLAQTDAERLKELLAVFRAAKQEPYSFIFLEAATGLNRKELEKSIARHHKQLAIALYGLVPLERGETELLERYLFFKKIAKNCSKYDAKRQANTRAAVQTGLTHLAQTAGYPDLARLEWAMESKINGDGVPLDSRETIVPTARGT